MKWNRVYKLIFPYMTESFYARWHDHLMGKNSIFNKFFGGN